jgi:hypothetical protein
MLLSRWKRRVDAPDLPKVITVTYAGTRPFLKGLGLKPDEYEAERKRLNELLNNKPYEDVEGRFEDAILIENKASGIWAIKELRRRKDPRLPIIPWNPPRGTTGQMGKYAHGGGMTTLDALWMGVPVVTWRGRTISSRLAAASLTALDLTDFIASDRESYVELAVAKASDPDALNRMRASLRPRLARSSVGDPERYARAVEAAYVEMWKRWCADRQMPLRLP